ncbi:MAG TPA: hypothetical protein VFO69_05690 [Allosphingosinicella sp.]|nr:hypothetical protein [Allosphingosinicella sp.]
MRLLPWLLAGLMAGCGSTSTVENESVTQEAEPSARKQTTAKAITPTDHIPVAFHGVYDRDPESCSSRSIYRLTVSAGQLRFHESLGTVRSVVMESDDVVRIGVDYEGEGETWSATQQLRLSDSGARLTVLGPGSTQTARIRCTQAEGASTPPGWEAAASGEGDGLFLRSAGGRQLTLFCPARSNDLIVNVPAFRPIGSEERMSFGSGGTVVVLVADTRGDSGRGGVSGRGPVPAELAAILAGSAGLSINYGAQNSGPHPAPPASMAASFVAGCRD